MRKPLIAGNWKMNLNHLEAIAVTQKLSYSLDDKDYDAVDVTVIPPFTDLRSVQTLHGHVDQEWEFLSKHQEVFYRLTKILQAQVQSQIKALSF